MLSKASCIHVEDEKKRVENPKIVSRQSTHHTWLVQKKRKLNTIDLMSNARCCLPFFDHS
jgi:hypothetical protein